MKKTEVLNEFQRKLVEENLEIVRWTIYKHIRFNEQVFGLSYEDLFQEGCICLCKAAVNYDGETARFNTYASVVVKNGLLSYCRNMCINHKKQLSLQNLVESNEKENTAFLDLLSTEDFTDAALSDWTVFSLLESVKPEYNGIARLGIEALELKVKGFSGNEIARLYGVAPNHIGAWISRAAKKLRQNERFLSGLSRDAC